MDRTMYIVVEGGVAHLQYDGPRVLHPGDTLTVEVRDFDLDDESVVAGQDAYGNSYTLPDDVTLTVAEKRTDILSWATEGIRLVLKDGHTAICLGPSADGAWIRARYTGPLQSPLVGTTDLIRDDEIATALDD